MTHESLCVIGNSHAGAIKRAWDEVAEAYQQFRLTFFAVGGEGLRDLKVVGRHIVPGRRRTREILEFTSGGESRIEVAKFDRVLIYGLGWAPGILRQKELYSRSAIDAARKDSFKRSIAGDILALIRMIDDKTPVYIGHSPLPAADPERDIKGVPSIEEYQRELEWFQAWLGDRGILIPQPTALLYSGMRTKPEYSKDSVTLATGDSDDELAHAESDRKHMNTLYGKAWLDWFFRVI